VASNHCEPDFHQQTTTVWFFIAVGPFNRVSTSHSDAPPVIHTPFLDAAASLYGNTTSQDPPAPRDGGAVAIFIPPGEPGRTRSTIYQQLTEGITLCQRGHEGACRNMPNTMVHQGATPGPAIPLISQPERCTSRVHRSESSPNRPRPSRLVQTTLVSPEGASGSPTRLAIHSTQGVRDPPELVATVSGLRENLLSLASQVRRAHVWTS